MRVIGIGPSGAGKGIHANNLASPHISTGRLFRESTSMAAKLGIAAKHFFEAADQSGVTNVLVANRISQPDCRRRGFILDGHPRALDQAEHQWRMTGDAA